MLLIACFGKKKVQNLNTGDVFLHMNKNEKTKQQLKTEKQKESNGNEKKLKISDL